jgi:CRISPR/Cas system CSM-associated protein Csm2 small subunit
MLTFKQYIQEAEEWRPEYTEWMSAKEAHDKGHITRSQFQRIGKHQDYRLYSGHNEMAIAGKPLLVRAQTNHHNIQDINIMHPDKKYQLHYHVSRKGKYYSHTVFKHAGVHPKYGDRWEVIKGGTAEE